MSERTESRAPHGGPRFSQALPDEVEMPRFFFHFASKERLVHDDQGAELGGLASAHLHALRLIVRTMRFMAGGEPERWTVQIADAEGTVLLTVLFPAGDRRASPLGRRPRGPAPFPVSPGADEDTPAALRGYAAALRAGMQPRDPPRRGP